MVLAVLVPLVAANYFVLIISWVLIVTLHVGRSGLDKITKEKKPMLGFAMLSGAIAFSFFIMWIFTPLMALSPIMLILLIGVEGLIYGYFGLKLLKDYFNPIDRLVSKVSSNENLEAKILAEIKDVNEILVKYKYAFESETLFDVAKIINTKMAKKVLQNKLHSLNSKLQRYKNKIKSNEDIADYWDKKNLDPIHQSIVRLALLSTKIPTNTLMDRVKDVELRVPTPGIYATVDFKGKADMVKRAKLNTTFWTKIRLYIEEHSAMVYFICIIGFALALTFLFFILISFVANSVGFVLLKTFYGYIICIMLFILLLANSQVFTDNLFHKIIQPTLMPAVGQPYGHEERGAISTALLGTYDLTDKKIPLSHEMQLGYINSSKETVDEWAAALKKTLQNNNGAPVHHLSSTGLDDLVAYELYHINKIANEFGWHRIVYMRKGSNWLRKPGKIMDYLDWVHGHNYQDQLYKVEADYNTELRPGYEHEAPYCMFNIMVGGEYNMSNPEDRKKAQVRDALMAEISLGGTELESNMLKTCVIKKHWEKYKDLGVGLNLLSDNVQKNIRSVDGKPGAVNVFNLDADNVVFPDVFLDIYAPAACRYNSRFVGIQQPRTLTNNTYDTVFASKAGHAHNILQFTQIIVATMLRMYSYYGKGAWNMSLYYLAISVAGVLAADTMSHDTVEAIGGLLYALLHSRGFSQFNYNKAIGEGAATTFPASTIRSYTRWQFGTMQSMRELFQPGAAAQKWITLLPIKGYWGELVFFGYILLGFFAVLFNVIFFSSSLLAPSLIMVIVFLCSMTMILFMPKFTDLNLTPGGAKRAFGRNLSELLLSTTIYLNNMWPGAQSDMRTFANLIQQKAVSIARTISWTPSAVIEAMFTNPTLKQSYVQFAAQRKIGMFLVFTLVFCLLFLPSLGLVWSNVLIYFGWAFPLFWSFLTGWFFAKKSGETRKNLVAGMDKIEDEGVEGQEATTFNAIIGREMNRVWDTEKLDKIWGTMGGLKNTIGDHIKDFILFNKAETDDSQNKIAKLICDRESKNVNQKTYRYLKWAGIVMMGLSIVGFLQVAFFVGLGMITTMSIWTLPLLGGLAGVGLFLILLTTLMLNMKKVDYNNPKGNKSIAHSKAFRLFMVLAGIGFISLGFVGLFVIGAGISASFLFGEILPQ